MKYSFTKYGKLLLLMVIAIVAFSFSALAKEKNEKDTMAVVKLTDIKFLSENELRFNLRLQNVSDNKWLYFANGTYQITFDVPEELGIVPDASKMNIKFTGNTDLKLMTTPGVNDELPKVNYRIFSEISKNNRISIFIVGPEDYENALYIAPTDTGAILGEFVLSGKNGFEIPEKLKWQEPLDFYQACAYKLFNDTLIAPGVVWHVKNSNLEMFDSLKNYITIYTKDNDREDFILDWFKVKYEGQKVVSVEWKTSSEPYNKGFILKRGIKPDFTMTENDVQYTDTIAYYPANPELKGTGRNGLGGLYFVLDSVDYRQVTYCYQLEYMFEKGTYKTDSLLARKCIDIPNAVIYEAIASPNPFKDKTNINFWLEDDAFVTVKVYDVRGKELITLCKDVPYKINMHQDPHVLTYAPGELAPTGVYQVEITAIPIKDQSITRSVSYLKVQLIR